MSLNPIDTSHKNREGSLLSPVAYDDDAASLHSRSEYDTDSDDDERQLRARNSRELRAHDRIVLMEEEEIDQLVTDSRRKQERERRGSNLALPNPLTVFRRYSETRSKSPIDHAMLSSEDLTQEKRASRRRRRKEKKDRLLAEARDGEDGELMYEMEEGGMKDGSSTGDSSDRDDSDELDRRKLKMVSDAKSDKRRKWRRWVFIHTLIAVGFAFLVLLAWKLSLDKKRSTKSISIEKLVSNGTALFAPTTLIISLDGFRADFLQRGLTPRLNAFIKEGISPQYMLPSFPSVTFPNHYTLATGLYPEAHGVVGNSFWDPKLQEEFYYTDPARSMDPKWWAGEPFWATAERQGVRTAIHMWPGSEAHIEHIEPAFLDTFNGKEKLENKVSRILELFDKPGMEDPDADPSDMRPQLIAAYVPNVDADGHRYGPNSTNIMSTIAQVDDMLDQLFKGFEERNLTNIVNCIIVSDHGMATTDVTRMIQLEDLIDLDKIEHLDGWPLVGLRMKNPDDLEEVHRGIVEKSKNNPNFEVYLRDVDMPERYHFSKNDRIAPLWIVPKTGWAIVNKEEFDIQEAKEKGLVYSPRGLHGYDHEHPLMRAIFVARGPAFPHTPNSRIEAFQNIEVYNILCDSIGLEPMPNNGTLRLPLKPIGLHDEAPLPEIPADPAEISAPATATPSEAATGMMSIMPVGVTSTAVQNEKPQPTVGVDPPQAEESPAIGVNPPEDQHADESPDDDDQGKNKTVWNSIQSGWDWLTGTISDAWHKVTGSEKSS